MESFHSFSECLAESLWSKIVCLFDSLSIRFKVKIIYLRHFNPCLIIRKKLKFSNVKNRFIVIMVLYQYMLMLQVQDCVNSVHCIMEKRKFNLLVCFR